MIREEGVPKLSGELRSISEVGMCVGGDEKRGMPGELAGAEVCRCLGRGETLPLVLVDCGGEVMSDVCSVVGGGPPAANKIKFNFYE